MRRILSLILIVALVCGTVPGAAGGDEPRAPRAPRKREAKGILLWGGLFLANSALLTLGLRDRAYYDDAGAEAESRGEDAGGYREGYDRAGLIVAASGVAALVSGVGFLRALRGRPASLPLAKPLAGPGAASPANDPVARAIEEIEARRALEGSAPTTSETQARSEEPAPPRKPAAGDRPAPIILSRVRTQQAWLPGTVLLAPDTSAAATDAAPAAPRAGEETAPAPPSADPPPTVADSPQPPASGGEPGSSARPPTRYAVQVASYRVHSDARSDSARWTGRGYPARVVEKNLGDLGVWYRVVLGDFARSADAESLADWLRGTFPKQDARVTRR